MASRTRIGITPRDRQAATALRAQLGNTINALANNQANSLRAIAKRLGEGFKLHIKFDRGKNLFRALDSEITVALSAIGLTTETGYDLLEAVSNFCFSHEDSGGAAKYPARLQGVTLELSELVALDKRSRNDQEIFHQFLDAFIRFKAIRDTLGHIRETVMLGNQPLLAVNQNKVQLMLDIIDDGYDIADLEGAIGFWQDGDIEPTVVEDVVQVSDLMQKLEDILS